MDHHLHTTTHEPQPKPRDQTPPRVLRPPQDTRNPVFVLFRFRKTGSSSAQAVAAATSAQAPVLKPCLYKKRASAADDYDDLAAF